MKIAVVLLLAIIGIATAAPLFAYSGNTTQSGTSAVPPSFDSDRACTTDSTATPYASQSITIATSGFYVLTAMFDQNSDDDAIITIYSTYNPATPCSGVVAGYYSSEGSAPHVYIPIQLAAGTYTVVVTTEDEYYSGVFVWHLDSVSWSGSTTLNGNYWNYIDYESDPSDCSSDGDGAAYTTYSWTQQTSGSFDINVWSQNFTSSDTYIEAALFNATASALPFVGQGTYTTPVDPCANPTTNSYFMMAREEDGYAKVSEAYGTGLYFAAVSLVAGRNYTVVVSTDDIDYYANFGITVSPTIWKSFGTTANYAGPQEDDDPSECSLDLNSNSVWYATSWGFAYPYFVVSTAESDAGADTILALYSGINVGSANQVTAPSSCTNFIYSTSDSPLGEGGFALSANFSVVVAPFEDEIYNNMFPLWVYTGIPVTTGSTSAASTTLFQTTTGAPTTTGFRTTTGAQTTTGSRTTTTTTSTGSSTGSKSTSTSSDVRSGASQVAASVLALVALIFAF